MNFETISHEAWLEKVKKELKKEELSEMHVSLTPNISIDPFFGRKPANSDGTRIVKDWEHKQIYTASTLSNKTLLEDLAGGINSVEIIVDQSASNWNKILENVIFDYIDLSFLIENKMSTEDLRNELDSLTNEIKILDNNLIFKCNSIDFVEQLKSIFKQIVTLLDNCEDENSRIKLFQQIRIDRVISTKMIAELGISESIEILSYNICKGFGLQYKCLEMHAICLTESDNVEANYIDLSLKALNAALGNYDAIAIDVASKENTSFHHRISRNIHHLMKEEAVLTQSRSAFKGAYQVKEISNKISEEIWSYIK